RLNLLRITAPARLAQAGVDLDAAPAVLAAARDAVSDGTLGYGLLIAEKPTRPAARRPRPGRT
ncbi:methyltransferase type 11, partial [Streptomyces sp. JJ38]|nr:methyltransferase type 11 [Streptomyces sp. JJ38]